MLFISPEKQYYCFEILNNHTFKKGNFINSNKNMFFLLTIIFLLNISIIKKIHNNVIINFFFIIILLQSFYIFKSELKLFFSALGLLTNFNYDYYYDDEFCFVNFQKNKIMS